MLHSEAPQGFLLALGRDNAAMDAFTGMDPDARRAVLEKARLARTAGEMAQIVAMLANSPM